MKHYYHSLAFVGGFNVMLLEMCGFRLLQIHFGSSIYVTGLLLTTVMISLALGYWFGGYLSERASSLRALLYPLLLTAGYVILVDAFLGDVVCKALFQSGRWVGYTVVPPTLATIVLFAAPMFTLSLITPFLVKWTARSRDARFLAVGQIAGRLMALSTIGSVLGTLATSFLLIPGIGLKLTFLLAAAATLAWALLGLSLAGVDRARAFRNAAAAMLAVAALTPVPPVRLWAAPDFESESLYNHIEIYLNNTGTKNEEIVYRPSHVYSHTVYYPNNLPRNFFFTEFLNYGLLRDAKRYLMLGSGGGAVLQLLPRFDPEASIVGVEIDPAVIEISKRFFGVVPDEKVRLVAEDARVFLARGDRRFDYAMVDVFRNDSIPTHCITKEFFEQLRDRLDDDGMVVANTNMRWPHLSTGLEDHYQPLHHFSSTLRHAGFPAVFFNNYYGLGLVYAFKQPTTLDQLRREIRIEVANEERELVLRVALALNYFHTMRTEDSWLTAEPFTDRGVPEHLIYSVHLRKFGGYKRRLRRALEDPAWEAIKGSLPRDLRVLGLLYNEAVFDDPAGEPAYRRSYVEGVMDWLQHNDGFANQDLVKYFLFDVAAEDLLDEPRFAADAVYRRPYHLLRGRQLADEGVRTGDQEALAAAVAQLRAAM